MGEMLPDEMLASEMLLREHGVEYWVL